jgi:hypothetical protein
LHVEEDLTWKDLSGKEALSNLQLVEKLGEGCADQSTAFQLRELNWCLPERTQTFSFNRSSRSRSYGEVYKARAVTGAILVVKVPLLEQQHPEVKLYDLSHYLIISYACR